MEEYGEQGFSCLRHVIILFSKQQTDPGAGVSNLHQVETAPPQEAPQTLQISMNFYGAVHPCCDTGRGTAQTTQFTCERTAPCCGNTVIQGVSCYITES